MKQRYLPDLQAFGKLCELNFQRLGALFPDVFLRAHSDTVMELCDNSVPGRISAEVSGVGPYTLILRLRQLEPAGPWVRDPDLMIRLYLDVRMAEVVGADRHLRVKSEYDYPNGCMHMPDEKFQLNHFLGEWLQYCLLHRSAANPLR